MQSDVKLSTKYLTGQRDHQIRMLVSVKAEAPVTRAPMNLALVLDRSFSMNGLPIKEAKRAAARFADYLDAGDRLAIVAFGERVQTIYGPGPADDPAVALAIRGIEAEGTTNLSGGWLEGRAHVQAGHLDGTNRVVLLTDGDANVGMTELEPLSQLARGAQQQGISTTCIGFGPRFNEKLLRAMSEAGSGNFWYIESEDQMTPVFDEEIEGLVSLAAQNLKVAVHLTDPRVHGVTFVQDYPMQRTAEGVWIASIGDLYGTAGRALGLIFHIEDVTELGRAQLGEVRVSADLVTAEGVEHNLLSVPIVANLDETDHIEPEVERTLVRFEVATARTEAVQHADRGQFDRAAAKLREAAQQLRPFADEPVLKEEVEDLEAEAERMEACDYVEQIDRKYHMARAMGARDLKEEYIKKVSRRKPGRPKGQRE